MQVVVQNSPLSLQSKNKQQLLRDWTHGGWARQGSKPPRSRTSPFWEVVTPGQGEVKGCREPEFRVLLHAEILGVLFWGPIWGFGGSEA